MELMLVHLKLDDYITGSRSILIYLVDYVWTISGHYSNTGTISYYTISKTTYAHREMSWFKS
jgi:hypothetical protein